MLFDRILKDLRKKHIAKKTKSHYQRYLNSQYFRFGKTIYGYSNQKNEQGVFIPIPEEMRILKTIFELFLDKNGKSLKEIKIELDKKHKTRSGNLFSVYRITHLLQNPIYSTYLYRNRKYIKSKLYSYQVASLADYKKIKRKLDKILHEHLTFYHHFNGIGG